jgi:CheY-like chemotaxis protein/HPt (histidine-containing phosphotransfer) domain-containing protein
MDRKTGFDLAQLIRSIAPRTPVVMLSADAEPRGCWEREDAGLEGYAIKPVRRSHLFQAMRDAMGIGRGRRSAHGPQAGPQAGSQEPTPATAAKRRGMRILVAEDAMNNRLLIRAFLKGSPHELIFAEDGQSAVNVFRREIFGLILMDIRMPVMDGLSAAKAIRDFERVEGRGATPILALSADASPADVNRSVAAGCQLHLSKPISKSRLLAAIDDFSAQPAKGGSSAGLGKAEETDAEDIGLDESIRELVPQYLRNCREALATIPGRIKSCDFEGIRSIGHNLKGTGTGYGFPEVTRLGAAMEFAAKQNQPEAVLRNAADLQSLMVGAESSRQLVYAE